MENLIQQTKKLNHDIQNGLTYLETARSAEVESVERKLHGQIDMVFGNCDRLDILVRKEPPNRREQAKLTVDQLKYDCNHLKSAMDNMLRRRYVLSHCHDCVLLVLVLLSLLIHS